MGALKIEAEIKRAINALMLVDGGGFTIGNSHALTAHDLQVLPFADRHVVDVKNRLERSASWAPMLLRIAGRCVSRLKDALARTLSTLGQPPRRLRRGTRRWSRFDWRNAAQLLRYLRSIKQSCGNATRSASTISIITTNGAEPLNISPSDTRGSFNVLFTT